MPTFSPRSIENLNTLAFPLQSVLNEAIKHVDFSIICGHRGESEQNAAFDNGYSKLRYPESKHNTFPSRAVDIMPWPINWDTRNADNLATIAHLMGLVTGIAIARGIRLRWGGDWDGDKRVRLVGFVDLPHLELLD